MVFTRSPQNPARAALTLHRRVKRNPVLGVISAHSGRQRKPSAASRCPPGFQEELSARTPDAAFISLRSATASRLGAEGDESTRKTCTVSVTV